MIGAHNSLFSFIYTHYVALRAPAHAARCPFLNPNINNINLYTSINNGIRIQASVVAGEYSATAPMILDI
jgi:hypothetical protein